jgi:hypothetical protein
MTKRRTFALLPVWAIALAVLLMLFALRAQVAQTLPFTSQGHHISAPQLGPGPMNAPVSNQPANAQGSNTVITRTGTTNPAAPQVQQPSTTNQPATGSNAGPCARAANPAPMCPVTAP